MYCKIRNFKIRADYCAFKLINIALIIAQESVIVEVRRNGKLYKEERWYPPLPKRNQLGKLRKKHARFIR